MKPPDQSTEDSISNGYPPPVEQLQLPPRMPVPRAPTEKMVMRRKPILSEEPEVQAAAAPEAPIARSTVTYTVQQQGPGANQRRNRHTLRLIGMVVLANNLLIAAAVVWFVYHTLQDIEGRLLMSPGSPQPAPAATTNAINEEAFEKRVATFETKFAQQTADLRKELAEAKEQTETAQKQSAASDQKLDQVTHRIADLAAQVQDHPAAPAAAAAPASPPSAVPLVAPESSTETPNGLNLPPTASELVLLKERNRLTAYADEAIATGAREPYEQLWKAISDPRLADLVHAARAEILRVQECYLSGQRAKYYGIAQYQIPIAEIFPDSATLTPAQLSDDQLIQVLQDQKVPWQARVKAAWYLGRRRTTKVGDALVKAAKEDPTLDVAAESTFSFEQVTGYRAKLFEPETLEAWWKSYNAAPPPNGKPKDDTAEATGSTKDKDKPKDKDAKSDTDSKSAKSGSDKPSSKEKKDSKKDAPEKKVVIPLREPDSDPTK